MNDTTYRTATPAELADHDRRVLAARSAAPVSVTVWGELPAERKLPGTVLRVLVAGQHAGAAERTADGWTAQAHGLKPSKPTAHATAEDAVRAVVRSAWARRLGARAASRVFWSDRARRAAAKSATAARDTSSRGRARRVAQAAS